MDYKKKYEEAERLYQTANADQRYVLESLFPKLRESEDEKARKEDEKEYKYVLKFVDNILNNCGNKKDYEHSKRCYDWLKSLRPQPKQEWSEEDQNALEDVREAVVHYWGGDSQDILLYWLKSLKQRIKGE